MTGPSYRDGTRFEICDKAKANLDLPSDHIFIIPISTRYSQFVSACFEQRLSSNFKYPPSSVPGARVALLLYARESVLASLVNGYVSGWSVSEPRAGARYWFT